MCYQYGIKVNCKNNSVILFLSFMQVKQFSEMIDNNIASLWIFIDSNCRAFVYLALIYKYRFTTTDLKSGNVEVTRREKIRELYRNEVTEWN